jgi:PDDEXK-like domain of unknown function (DUF3799)
MSAAVSIEPCLRTCDEDGTHHHSTLKKLALSGAQYLQAVNYPTKPTSAMLLGSLVHFLILGARTGAKPLIKYDGQTRQGNAWKEFAALHSDSEILTAPEWAEGEEIAEEIRNDPAVRARITGARLEVPLVWEEGGLKFSTSGVDILTSDDAAGDLKTTTSVNPETWTKQAFRMHYPQQLALYRRGLRAHGIRCSRGLFLLGAEIRAPFECVDLELTEGMIDFADRTVSLWIEKLRVYRESIPHPKKPKDWPGYAQSPIPFDVPTWMQEGDEDDDG